MEVQRQQDTPGGFIMRTRKGYCPQQRKAREQADRALCKKAGALLADPDAVAAMVTQLVTDSRSPRVLRYSLRNQALLISQAEQRGMRLTDVDSFAGWKNRGRRVRKGEHGLRIVAPTGTKTGEDVEQDENTSATDEHQSGKQLPIRFHMVTVFDICQTEAIDDAETLSRAGLRMSPTRPRCCGTRSPISYSGAATPLLSPRPLVAGQRLNTAPCASLRVPTCPS
jgi:N-terminal domain of anti-restriction factor ArdC